MAYKPVIWRQLLYYLLCVLSAGVMWLLCTYYRRLWEVQITCAPCSLAEARYVIVRDSYDQVFLSDVIIAPWRAEIVRPQYIYSYKTKYNDRHPLKTAEKVNFSYFK